MNVLSQALQKLVTGVSAQVGTAVTSTPEAKAAITAVQDEIDKWQKTAYVAGALAAVVFVFYFMPRFESPIPRIFRGRR